MKQIIELNGCIRMLGKKTLVKVVENSEVKIESMYLSGHRRFPFGSREQSNREKAKDMMKWAICMSCKLR